MRSSILPRGFPPTVIVFTLLATLACHDAIPSASSDTSVIWDVDRDPILTLGHSAGDPGQAFGRIAGALLLTGDHVVVADALSNEVKWFGSDGRLLRRAGGTGDGPGEFRRIQSIQRIHGDSVVVFDGSSGRLTVFDDDMNMAAVVTLARGGGAAAFRMQNGSIMSIRGVAPSWGNPPLTGVRREPVDVLWHTPDGRFFSKEGTYPGVDVFVVWAPDPRKRVLGVPPIARWTQLAVEGHRYVVATGDEGPLTVVDVAAGDTIRVQLHAEDLALTPELLRIFSAAVPSRDIPAPERRPPYSRVILEAEWLWVSSFAAPPEVPDRWTAYSLSRGGSRRVLLPHGVDLLSVAPDRVLGVRKDRWGVEHIEVYVLRRNEPLVDASRQE